MQRKDSTQMYHAIYLFCRGPFYRTTIHIQTPSTLLPVKRVIRYLKGTLHHGITYRFRQSTRRPYGRRLGPLTPSTRRSLGAYVFLLHGGAVSCPSKRQTINRTVFICGLRFPEELGGATALNVDCVGGSGQ